MHLHRVTPDAFEDYNMPPGGKYLGQEADCLKASVLQFDGQPAVRVVVARFDRFGAGTYRKSDYEVLSNWSDVEEMIAKFCEAGHPGAIALVRARQLAKAVKSVGWREPSDS